MNTPAPQILVAQLGSRLRYAVPLLFQQAGMLSHFYTDAYVGKGSSWHILTKIAPSVPETLRPAVINRLLGRREDRLAPEKVTAFNMFGLSYVMAATWARRRNLGELEKVTAQYGQRFCEKVAKKSDCQADAVYALQSNCRALFQKAREEGRTAILEQYCASPRIDFQLTSEEHTLWPGWENPSLDREGFLPIIDLVEGEWQLADGIICPSPFVADGLKSSGIPPEKIRIVPYGVETSRFAIPRLPWDGRRPLHVLFVGSLYLRKGPQYLYQALEALNSVQITAKMVGGVGIREPFLSLVRKRAEITGHIPYAQVKRVFEWADIFVFPSICEGSAAVTYEALAAGLPVITTPNAGSVVRDGLEGFVVPIRAANALAEKIELLAAAPQLVAWMSLNARQRAEEFSWQKYGERLRDAVKDIVASHKRIAEKVH